MEFSESLLSSEGLPQTDEIYSLIKNLKQIYRVRLHKESSGDLGRHIDQLGLEVYDYKTENIRF